MRRTGLRPAVLLFLTVAATLTLASAAEAANGTALAAGYWYNFRKFWVSLFATTNGVVLVALGVAAVSLFIITRGKWRK